MFRRHRGKRRMRHVDEVPVLVLAVHAGQAAAAHLCVIVAQGLVLAVHIACIPEIELQRVVVILAEIHQRVHFLVGEGVFRHHGALGIGHTGTVAGNDVIRPDAAQLLPVHARIGAAGAQRKFHPGGLQFFHGLYHRRAGLRLPKGHQCIVKIAYQKFVLHSFLLHGSVFSTSIPQIGTPWGFCCIKNRSRLSHETAPVFRSMFYSTSPRNSPSRVGIQPSAVRWARPFSTALSSRVENSCGSSCPNRSRNSGSTTPSFSFMRPRR